MKNIRIDPLKIDGTFDTDFFGSEEYSQAKKIVEKYIVQEGFDQEPNTYFLNLADQYWQIVVT